MFDKERLFVSNIDVVLFEKKRKIDKSKKVKVNLYSLTDEFFDLLNRENIINRLKEISQLGVIKTKRELRKSRYDYIMLQLYLHKLVRDNLHSELKFSYSNTFKENEFSNEISFAGQRISIGDLVQLMVIVYNMGHFYNTFVSSRGMIMHYHDNPNLKELLMSAYEDENYKKSVSEILDNYLYRKFHLINSLTILSKMDDCLSVKIARKLLILYLNKEEIDKDGKIGYVFYLFDSIRKAAYISYDLEIAKTPIVIDLGDKDAILSLLKELISSYNNRLTTNQMINSISKLLEDKLYNKEYSSIDYYNMSKIIKNKLKKTNIKNLEDYITLWKEKDSVVNSKCRYNKNYDSNILKLTFKNSDTVVAHDMLSELNHTNDIRVGYYDRSNGDKTILVALKTKSNNKLKTSFNVMRIAIKHLNKIDGITKFDNRFLLTSKFFLYYLFNENPLKINPTIDNIKCLFCARGRKSRIDILESMIKNTSCDSDDIIHEVETLVKMLKNDTVNDVAICIPASVQIYNKLDIKTKLYELDGMVLFPNRKQNSIVFFESKNKVHQKSAAQF